MRRKAAAKADKMQAKKESKATRASKLADLSPVVKLKASTSKSSSRSKKTDKDFAPVPDQQKPLMGLGVEHQEDDSKAVSIHSKYTIQKTHALYSHVENLVALLKNKQVRKDKKLMKVVEYTVYPTFEFELQGVKPDHDKCCICQFEFSDCLDHEKELLEDAEEDVVAIRCGHMLHKGCLKNYIGDKTWIRCPVCFTIFGVMIGDQPPGTMTWTVEELQCDGYPQTNTIIIEYQMGSGSRNGVAFSGTGRTAYLPDTPEGNEVLQLLKTAFDRKLIFTVGTSVTTGRDNCVVWNGIHHKTDTHGGSSCFGYPDPTYFQRVKLELAAKGVY